MPSATACPCGLIFCHVRRIAFSSVASAVRAAWEQLFAESPDAWFDTEELIAAGDRVVVRWRYRWGPGGSGGHVRGIDVFRVADGLITEKLAYVKG